MTKSAQIAYNRVQAVYRAYLLDSIQGDQLMRERALDAIVRAVELGNAEEIELKSVGGFIQ